MKNIYITLALLIYLSPFNVMAGSDNNIIFLNNVKISDQTKAVVKRAKKGNLIGVSPSLVNFVCDFNKQIFVNNYIKGGQVTAYCSYVGYARKLINK
ncbi:MAG: hypothetical protein QM504_14260 [Pseudomonadota bacterium]